MLGNSAQPTAGCSHGLLPIAFTWGTVSLNEPECSCMWDCMWSQRAEGHESFMAPTFSTVKWLVCYSVGYLAKGDVNKTIHEWKWAFPRKSVINNLWGSEHVSNNHTSMITREKHQRRSQVHTALVNGILHPAHIWFNIFWCGGKKTASVCPSDCKYRH